MFKRKMTTVITIGLLLIALFFTGGCNGSSDSSKMQVYYNAKVFTTDKDNPSATAFAVKDDKFVCVGDKATVLEYAKGKNAEMIDLNGARVLPGFIEGHNHKSAYIVLSGSKFLQVAYTDTKQDIKRKINEYVKKNPDIDILIVIDADETFEMRAKDWDEIYSEKPLFVIACGAHVGWANSKMLKEMRLTKETKDPVPGVSYFSRDKDGNPDGYIFEIPAMMLVCNNYPLAIPADEAIERLVNISTVSNEMGFTGSLEAHVQFMEEEEWLKALSKLEKQGRLTIHEFTGTLWLGNNVSSLEELKERALYEKEKYSSRLIHPGTVKMFADGTPGAKSALMRQEYENMEPGYHGLALTSLDDLTKAAEMCRDNDLNIHVHAIGDAAIDNVLAAYEKAGKMKGTKSIAHYQFTPQDIIDRTAKLGVIVNTTPNWTIMPCEDVDNLQASKESYNNIQPAFEAGIPVNFGSDSIGSLEYWDPLLNIYMAITRKPNSDEYQLCGTPITIEQAIEAYTINPAKEKRAENEIGSITKGKYADFIILSHDILDPKVSSNMFELDNTGGVAGIAKKNVYVDKTYFCGKCVFTR